MDKYSRTKPPTMARAYAAATAAASLGVSAWIGTDAVSTSSKKLGVAIILMVMVLLLSADQPAHGSKQKR
jgi:hypothetical protein